MLSYLYEISQNVIFTIKCEFFIRYEILKVLYASCLNSQHLQPAKLKLLKTGRLQKTWRDKLSPRISGLDFLPDGRVTCADNYNRKVFILNGDLQRVGSAHTFDATSNPRDVACCNLEMIAVTLK